MSNTKLVVFQVLYGYPFQLDVPAYFHFRYGKQEIYPIRTIFILIGFGLALSFPNILSQYIRKYKKKENPTSLTIWMDIILHLAYANIASIFINSETNPAFYVGIAFLGLYVLFLIYNFALIIEKQADNTIFTGFQCILKKCKSLRTFEEAIKDRRKLPPQILIEYTPISYQDEQMQKKTTEYEYCSWEDITDINLNEDRPIINCFFKLEVNINKESTDDFESFKKDFEDCNVKKLCPGFEEHEKCFRISNNNKFNYFLLFFWFILFITGYIDILDIFIYYRDCYREVTISKIISNSNIYRALYKQMDVLNSEEKNESNKIIELNDYQPLL